MLAHGIVALDLPAEEADEPLPVEIRLRRGAVVRVRVVGPEGTPIERGVAVCRTQVAPGSPQAWPLPVENGAFELPGCAPTQSYPVLVVDEAGRSGGCVMVPGRSVEEVTVRLQACGEARVRVLDDAGQPRRNAFAGHLGVLLGSEGDADPVAPLDTAGRLRDVHSTHHLDPVHYPDVNCLRTDADGWLRLKALVPGVAYVLYHYGPTGEHICAPVFRVQAGERKTLPDMAIRHPQLGDKYQ
jgi:hypothetical protein